MIDSAALAENTMMRARAGDTDVLLVRQHGRVCALIHACAHLGGPLSEGTLKGLTADERRTIANMMGGGHLRDHRPGLQGRRRHLRAVAGQRRRSRPRTRS